MWDGNELTRCHLRMQGEPPVGARPRFAVHSPPVLRTFFLLLCFSLVPTLVGAQTFEYAEDELAFSLNPLHESSMAETRLNELLFEGLWGPSYDGGASPRLADGYELSEDQLSLKVFLKEGLHWSDGQPITARDVVFTVEAFGHPHTESPDHSRLAFIKKAEAKDDSTVVLTFHEPEPNPLEKLFFKILPAHKFDSPAVGRDDPFWYMPVTSGPYTLEQQDLGSWTLAAAKDALRPPAIERVVSREMPDKNQQVSSLGYGYVQAMIQVPSQYLPEVERSRNADLVPYQSKSWWYLGLNNKQRDLSKVPVRTALSRAIDLDSALELIGEGYRISGPFVPSSKFYNHRSSVQLPTYDRAEATMLMEAAGYERGEDGTWHKGGEPVSLRLFYRSGLGERGQAVALNIQAQLRRFGIDAADPVAMDKAVWAERVFGERDFDVVLDSWSFDRNENIYDLFHSKGTMNFVGYSNKEVDDLLARSLVETDPVAKVTYLKQVHLLLARDLPYVFCWSLRNYSAVRREVRSVFIQPFYYFSQFSDWKLSGR